MPHHGHERHIGKGRAGASPMLWVMAASSIEQEDTMPNSVTKVPAPGSVTMFTTSWCGYCNRLKAQMGREGIGFTEVNIEEEPEAVAFVMDVNGGNQTVPTLLFPDGSAATNPSINEVKKRLAS
jgi:mycoredoxin